MTLDALVLEAMSRNFPPAGRIEYEPDDKWESMLARNKEGQPRPILENAVIALMNDRDVRGCLWMNDFTNSTCIRGPLPHEDHRKPRYERDATDVDFIEIRRWLQRHGIMCSKGDVEDAIESAASANRRHPVREYLRGLRWDGDRRIDRFLTDYFGCEDTEYVRAVSGKFLISLVARVLEPGCKVDTMLIIEGPQGIGKSSGLRALMPNPLWFSDTRLDPDNKDTVESMLGKWLVEHAELAGMSRREGNSMKAFLSRQSDRIRRAYAKKAVDIPRQSVFVGTTNDTSYLEDETGARRYWPVRASMIDLEGIASARDQIWAEARDMWLAGASWHLSRDEETFANEERSERLYRDPWEEPVISHIERVGEATRHELLEMALGIALKDRGRAESMRIAKILISNGYDEKPVKRNGRVVRVFSKKKGNN